MKNREPAGISPLMSPAASYADSEVYTKGFQPTVPPTPEGTYFADYVIDPSTGEITSSPTFNDIVQAVQSNLLVIARISDSVSTGQAILTALTDDFALFTSAVTDGDASSVSSLTHTSEGVISIQDTPIGGDDKFFVHYTLSDLSGISCDKTYAEILEAYNAHKIIYATGGYVGTLPSQWVPMTLVHATSDLMFINMSPNVDGDGIDVISVYHWHNDGDDRDEYAGKNYSMGAVPVAWDSSTQLGKTLVVTGTSDVDTHYELVDRVPTVEVPLGITLQLSQMMNSIMVDAASSPGTDIAEYVYLSNPEVAREFIQDIKTTVLSTKYPTPYLSLGAGFNYTGTSLNVILAELDENNEIPSWTDVEPAPCYVTTNEMVMLQPNASGIFRLALTYVGAYNGTPEDPGTAADARLILYCRVVPHTPVD